MKNCELWELAPLLPTYQGAPREQLSKPALLPTLYKREGAEHGVGRTPRVWSKPTAWMWANPPAPRPNTLLQLLLDLQGATCRPPERRQGRAGHHHRDVDPDDFQW